MSKNQFSLNLEVLMSAPDFDPKDQGAEFWYGQYRQQRQESEELRQENEKLREEIEKIREKLEQFQEKLEKISQRVAILK